MKPKKIAKQVEVAVQKDHLKKLSKTRHPVHAVQELIWNSLDADADSVEVIIERNLWGGVQRLAVVDDGEGILPARALEAFERLGGSWKQDVQVTPKGRKLHGQGGKGRFAAFSLGRHVSWESIAMDAAGDLYSCRVEATGDKINCFTITGGPLARGRQAEPGTIVKIDGIPEAVHGLIGEDVITAMHDKFSLYLVKYPHVKIVYDGELIDPHSAITHIESCEVSVEVDGESVHADVDIVEWKRKGPRGIYLCDSEGFSIQDVAIGKSTHGRRITAHIKSEVFATLQASGSLSVGDLHPVVRGLLNRTRDEVGDYCERSSKRAAVERVKGWRDEDVYPFVEPPKDPIETAQQQAFVVLANEVEERVPEVQKHGQKAKRLLFRLLRDAIERGADQIRQIFAQVLELTDAQQQDLAQVLDKTNLSSIVSSAKVVADRLDFLTGLEVLIYEHQGKVKERGELQRLVESNAWMFGEEFYLAGSEISLDGVLRRHAKILGKQVSPGKVAGVRGKKTDIVDMFLARSVPYWRGQEHHHLVVELKRPSRTIGIDTFNQTVGYAMAVAKDRRFRDRKVRWSFWMMGADMDDYVRSLARSKSRPRGCVEQLSDEVEVEVWAFTWSELINDCQSRMAFFKQNLGYAVTANEALEKIKSGYPDFVNDAVIERDAETPTAKPRKPKASSKRKAKATSE